MKLALTALSEPDVANYAAGLSLWARAGDVILLNGDLGIGKSVFARSFIRGLADDPLLDIPSPSFPIIQIYDQLRLPVAHVDLYRLTSAEEVFELGLNELAKTHVLLIEWPERLGDEVFREALVIDFSGSGTERDLAVSASSGWVPRLTREQQLQAFLAQAVNGPVVRRFLEGDASSRRYETLAPYLIMDMPKRPDGPVVRHGKPYSAIAHLAEDISAVVGVNDYLIAQGYSAPHIAAVDLDHGFALIENLGDKVYGRMMRDGADMREPMGYAVQLLADMAGRAWPQAVSVRGQKTHVLAPYDDEAMMIEVDLLTSWYWPHITGTSAPSAITDDFTAIWNKLVPLVKTDHPVWVLRDFHSPNLIWLPERDGIAKVGVIDTQDAVLGHPAYDLVSLLQDARVDVEAGLADRLLADYCALRQGHDGFDAASFTRAFAILGAQRATKILGIFARLAKRDGKPQYLQHMPRVKDYLRRNLEHPALHELKAWHQAHLPLDD